MFGGAMVLQTATGLQSGANVIKIERWFGTNLGDVGGVQPGSLEQAMHMKLGTLPASHHASEA